MASINPNPPPAASVLVCGIEEDPQKSEEDAYEKKLQDHGVGSPLKGPDGRVRRGTFKVARKTNKPGWVALTASPHKCVGEINQRINAEMTENEIAILRKVQEGPHFPRLYDSFSSGNRRYTTIQEDVGQDLFNAYLNSDNPSRNSLTISQLERICKQQLESLAYLHKEGILHGDVKPENSSINEHGYSFLFDFGLSQKLDEKATLRTKYSRPYRPPETVLKMGTRLSSDIWAMGVMFFELATRRPFIRVYDGKTKAENLQADINMVHAYQDRLNANYNLEVLSANHSGLIEEDSDGKRLKPSTIDKLHSIESELSLLGEDPRCRRFVELVTKMLGCSPELRITAEAALAHPFFTSDDSSDRSFKLNVTGSRRDVGMHIFIGERLCATINLSESLPSYCYHIRKSNAPYSLAFFKLNEPNKLIGSGEFSLSFDKQMVAIDTDQIFSLASEQVLAEGSSSEKKGADSSVQESERPKTKRKLFD